MGTEFGLVLVVLTLAGTLGGGLWVASKEWRAFKPLPMDLTKASATPTYLKYPDRFAKK